MKLFLAGLFCLALTFSIVTDSTALGQDSEPPESRSFEFNYGAKIADVPAGAKVRVWFPVAESNGEQVVDLTKTATPAPLELSRDKKYQNKIGYFQVESVGTPVSFSVKYQVERLEASSAQAARLSDEEKVLFLKANSLVPITGRPQRLLERKTLPAEPMAAGRALYDIVEQHMTYDKSKPGYGNGDAVWACDSQTGNCTDFHSLFISLARSRSIPAKFEIGFPLGLDDEGSVKGYHCWAWFYSTGTGWTPINISEADKHPELKEYFFGNLTADRVAFSKGRDIKLVPTPNTEPLNYFIYPHVEVDGKAWPKEKIQFDFSYRNQVASPNTGTEVEPK